MTTNNKSLYYRRGNEKDVIVHTSFQQPDGLYPVDGKLLTESDLNKLIALAPNASWTLVRWPGEIFTNRAEIIERLERHLKDEFLHELSGSEPLTSACVHEILTAIHGKV